MFFTAPGMFFTSCEDVFYRVEDVFYIVEDVFYILEDVLNVGCSVFYDLATTHYNAQRDYSGGKVQSAEWRVASALSRLKL